MTQFNASIRADKLLHAASALRRINHETIFECSTNKITSQLLDRSHAMLTRIYISMVDGNYCRAVRDHKVGIDLDKMLPILKRADPDENITIEADGNVWYISRGNYQCRHQRSLPLLDPAEVKTRLPYIDLSQIKLDHIANVILSGKEFKEIIAEAKSIDAAIGIQANAYGMSFDIVNVDNPAENYICEMSDRNTEITGDTTAASVYSIDFFADVAKDMIANDEVMLRFGNDTPCEISYTRDGVWVNHLISPRIVPE